MDHFLGLRISCTDEPKPVIYPNDLSYCIDVVITRDEAARIARLIIGALLNGAKENYAKSSG